jgi:hypothetical protein
LRRQLLLLTLIRGICWGGVALLGFNALLVGSPVSAVPIALVFVLLPTIDAVSFSDQALTPNGIQGRYAVKLMVAGGRPEDETPSERDRCGPRAVTRRSRR